MVRVQQQDAMKRTRLEKRVVGVAAVAVAVAAAAAGLKGEG